MNDLSKIAKRHADIPQDPLFELPQSTGGGPEVVRDRSPKSIKWAQCPQHVPEPGRRGGLTGLIAGDKGELVFRDHTKRVGKTTVPCPGSGQPAPTKKESPA